MLDPNALEKFNTILNDIGNEVHVSAERGEKIEDIPPPDPNEFLENVPPAQSPEISSSDSQTLTEPSTPIGSDRPIVAESESSLLESDSFADNLSIDDLNIDDISFDDILDSQESTEHALTDDFGTNAITDAIEDDESDPFANILSTTDNADLNIPADAISDDSIQDTSSDYQEPTHTIPPSPTDDSAYSRDPADEFGFSDLLASVSSEISNEEILSEAISPPSEKPKKSLLSDLNLAEGIEISDQDASTSEFDITSESTPQSDSSFDMDDLSDEQSQFIMDDIGNGDSASDSGIDLSTGSLSISEKEYEVLKTTLNELPLNLKIVVAGIVTSGKYGTETIHKLVSALGRGDSVQSLAELAGKISGKQVHLPQSFTKQSGEDFEKEKDKLGYRFRATLWPVLRVMLTGTALFIGLALLGYNFIYQPLRARNFYVQGLENIEIEQYERANNLFNRGYATWPVNERFLDYARAFRGKRQFALAREKYEQLLSEAIDPLNKDAILEFSSFSTYDLRDYEASLDYLDRLIQEDVWDFEALTAQGDTFIEWALQFDTEERRSELLEQARFTYASLISRYGQRDDLLFKMLRYFILTRNVTEALALKELFLEDEDAELDPYGLSELAGFLLDLNDEQVLLSSGNPVEDYINALSNANSRSRYVEDAREILDKAIALNDEIPEIHYHIARHSREIGDLQNELVALENTQELYNDINIQRPLNRFEVAREIDSYIRYGELMYRFEEFLRAEDQFQQAVNLYERAILASMVDPEPQFGRVYAALGDLYYYQAGDYESAQVFYLQARENNFGSLGNYTERFEERRDIAYKLGFINFFQANSMLVLNRATQSDQQELLDTAIREFNNAEGAIPTANLNLLYAKANTQYLRQNYSDAVSLYRLLINELSTNRARISTFLIEEDDLHRSLIDFQIRANNNLGTALYRLFEQGGVYANDYFAQSQLFLSRSTELAENFARDFDTAVRAETQPLAYLNLRNILSPIPIGNVQIDPDLRKDLSSPFF